MSKAKCVLAFIIGAGVGSAVTWKLLKTKYEQIAQEEIDSVKEHFAKRNKEPTEFVDDISEIFGDKEEEGEYEEVVTEMGYTDNKHVRNAPYVIHPDMFGTRDDFEIRSLKCFADRVVTDTDYEIVEDVDNLVGDESLDHFGEFEEDSVYVRNERLKCDYEILLDTRKYTDVVGEIPHRAED